MKDRPYILRGEIKSKICIPNSNLRFKVQKFILTGHIMKQCSDEHQECNG